MKGLKTYILTILFFLSGICFSDALFAQNKPKPAPKTKAAETKVAEEIVITEHPADKHAIFKLNDTISYSVDLKSTYGSVQEGKITYFISDFTGKLLNKQSLPVKIAPNGFQRVKIDMPSQKPGFYKVNFALNVTDDDDTVRRVFGVDTANMVSPYKRPADFDAFWDKAKKELATVQPDFKMTEMPKLGGGNDQVYLVEMRSLGNIVIRGWLTLPKDRKPGQKLPVTLGLPGYGGEMVPFRGISPGIAYLGLNVRGLGNSRDVIHLLRDEYISYGVEDKNKYIFRGVMMDCVRAVDFICSRPELDGTAIYTSGGSMGAYLALALSSLDDRIALCSADNPGYPDIRYIDKTWQHVFPINTLHDFAKAKGLNYQSFLDTWDYYDLKNFVQNIKCPTIVGIGLLDNFIPPEAEMYMYRNIKAPKKIFIFPNIAHEVGPEMGLYVGRWVYDKLDIYKKWVKYNGGTVMAAAAPPPPKPDADALRGETITIAEKAETKKAIFKLNMPISYNIDIKSTYKKAQVGKVSYKITTTDGKLVTQNSVPVSVPAKESKTLTLDMPAQSTGFYNVSFMVNLTDYDDTIRRVFGVDTLNIRDNKPKPADFDVFWLNAKRELAKIAPNYKITEKPALSHGNDKVYLVEMQSLGNVTVRGYMTLPMDVKDGQRLPVSIYFPGYGAQAQPMYGVSGMALLSLSVRGQALSNDVVNPDREAFITEGIENKNKYILRGAIMDCMRMVDFVGSRPDLDTTAIYVTGASMGGYLAIAEASLDKRVTICSANNPTFSDFRELAKHDTDFPMGSIKYYAKNNNLSLDDIQKTLEYFDLKNFAFNVKCPTMVGIGLLDNIAPPTTQFAMYNNIPAQKSIQVFPDLPHDVGPEMGTVVGKWVFAQLHVYDKWRAFNEAELLAKAKEEESGSSSIALIEYPDNKDAVFKNAGPIGYGVDLKNNFFTKQDAKFSWFVYTKEGKLLKEDSVRVSLGPRSTKRVHVDVPPQKTGFYNISFAIEVPDYDDTLKRTFGVDIYNIHEVSPRPADFDTFWDNTKKELAKVPPNFRMTEKPELEKEGEQIYLIEMQSLDNITVRGWLTLPKDRRPKDKFPVYLALPGYGNTMTPNHGISSFAYIGLNPRGLGNSRDDLKPTRDEYITWNLEDKNKFIYRGAIMDIVRMIDFIYSRPEFDTESIFVNGGSQGGYLSLAAASVDPRVSILAAANPGYIELRSPYYINKWPISAMVDYADLKSVKFDQLVNNFDYFDLKNFVSRIRCKVLVGIGLLDPLVPPTNSLMMFNNIKAPKKLFIYPRLTHEVAPEFSTFKSKWMMDELGAY